MSDTEGEEYVGKLLRLFIINHNKNKCTSKQEMCEFLCVNKLLGQHILEKATEYITVFNLKIVQNTLDPNKYFVVTGKTLANRKKEIAHENISIEKKQLYTILGCIQITCNEFKNAEMLKECSLFNSHVEETLKKFKTQGYITKKIEKNEIIWQFGWRYYLEYSHFMDSVEYFKLK